VSVENANGERIILLPGEGIIVENRNSPLRKEKFDESLALGWMQGVYFFTNEKLEQLSIVAKRWLDVDIELKDPTLAGLHFTGALDRNKPVSHFLNRLASSGDIRYEIRGSKVSIFRK
jgi:ferric-dicitrate binding protein FerR (iron transport regulator)